MLKPNAPMAFALKFPLGAKDPVSVSPETKQGDEVVKVKFVTVTLVPLPCIKVVDREKAGELSLLVKVACQLPLIFLGDEFPPPHPPRNKLTALRTMIPSGFILAPRDILLDAVDTSSGLGASENLTLRFRKRAFGSE